MRTRIGNLDIAYDDVGHGIPLLLVHGFPVDRRVWRPQVPVLSRHCRVLALDLPGHGDSTPTGEYTMESLARLLEGFLDTLGVERAVLLGYSMGGSVALEFSRTYPKRLYSLILYASRAVADSEEEAVTREALAEVASLLESQPIVVEEVMLDLVSADAAIAAGGPVTEAVREMVGDTPRLTFKQGLLALARRPDYTPTLSSIPCPTLVVVGERDTVTPPAAAQDMVARIPGARLVVLPGAGHFANLDSPQEFNRTVLDFLAVAGLRGANRR